MPIKNVAVSPRPLSSAPYGSCSRLADAFGVSNLFGGAWDSMQLLRRSSACEQQEACNGAINALGQFAALQHWRDACDWLAV